MDDKELSKILSTAVKTGKCVLGLKEAQKSIRGSKIVVYSTHAPKDKQQRLVEACKAANVPILA